MWEYLQNAPLGNLITIGLFVLIVLFLLIGVFAPEMARMASKRLDKANKEPKLDGTDSEKLDSIRELLTTRMGALEKRQDLSEKQNERTQKALERTQDTLDKTQNSIEGLVQKIEDGFRSITKRLDDHIASDRKV